MLANELLFYVFGAAAVVASLLVIGQRSPIYSVLLLIASFAALAGLYVLLDAPFLAVIQIIIYAGAIMVLFLFVVMLLNTPREEGGDGQVSQFAVHGPRRLGALLGIVLVAELVWSIWRASVVQESLRFVSDRSTVEGLSSVRRLGRTLFTDYAFPFEVTSILIIVAMVGAVVLAKRDLSPRAAKPTAARPSTSSGRPGRVEGRGAGQGSSHPVTRA